MARCNNGDDGRAIQFAQPSCTYTLRQSPLYVFFSNVFLLEETSPPYFICASASNRNVEFSIRTDAERGRKVAINGRRSFGFACNFCQTCAAAERVASNARHGVGDGDTLQARAVIEYVKH